MLVTDLGEYEQSGDKFDMLVTNSFMFESHEQNYLVNKII